MYVVNALTRAGFRAARRSRGSHQTFARVHADGHKDITVVVLGKREIPRGTPRSIIRSAGLSVEEFRALLR